LNIPTEDFRSIARILAAGRATSGSATSAGANLPLIVRPHRALLDTRLTALRKEKVMETAMQMQKEIEALSRMTVDHLR